MLGNNSGGWFRDGVYVVPLADIDVPVEESTNGADIFATAIADALGFVLSGPDRPYQQVLRYLREQHMLLVLDNLERVLHLTPAIVHLLEQTPSLTILATSTVIPLANSTGRCGGLRPPQKTFFLVLLLAA